MSSPSHGRRPAMPRRPAPASSASSSERRRSARPRSCWFSASSSSARTSAKRSRYARRAWSSSTSPASPSPPTTLASAPARARGASGARFDHYIVVPNPKLCRLDEAAPRSEEGEAASLEALTGLGVHCGGGVLEGGVEGEAGAPVDGRIVGLDEQHLVRLHLGEVVPAVGRVVDGLL